MKVVRYTDHVNLQEHRDMFAYRYRYRDVDRFLVDASGRVRLPAGKQQALIALASELGQGSVTVTSVTTYEQALLAIFDRDQRPLVEAQIAHYRTIGFAQSLKDSVPAFSDHVGMTSAQDLVWLDYLGVMTQYEALQESET